MKLKVLRDFLLKGQRVRAGDVVEVSAWMGDYLLGLDDSPVEGPSPSPSPDREGESVEVGNVEVSDESGE